MSDAHYSSSNVDDVTLQRSSDHDASRATPANETPRGSEYVAHAVVASTSVFTSRNHLTLPSLAPFTRFTVNNDYATSRQSPFGYSLIIYQMAIIHADHTYHNSSSSYSSRVHNVSSSRWTSDHSSSEDVGLTIDFLLTS